MKVSGVLLAAAAAVLAVPGPQASGAPGSVVRVEHHDPSLLPSRGPSNALVTIELFYTPGPSARHQAVRALERLQANHPSRIRIVYRIVKGHTARLHYAAVYAYSEGKFFELMDALNAAPRALDDAALLEIGRKVGLDPERLSRVIRRPPAAYDAVLEENERRRRQKIRGNPSLPNVLFNGRVPGTQLSALTTRDLEREYENARQLALDLLDQGVDRAHLSEAFDRIVRLPDEIVVVPGPTDEELEDTPPEPVLAKAPLSFTGLPSHGPAEAPITIAVLCSPTSQNCIAPLRTAQTIADRFPEDVRVVWAPSFDVGREDAAALSLLGDAALCAERDGGRSLDRNDDWDPKDSPGWRWVRDVLVQSASRTRKYTPDELIDRVVERLRVEPRAFATCRAQVAGSSIAWIESARRAGVRWSPATIVNGRIYGPINNEDSLQQLVAAELAPGILAPSWTRPDEEPRK
jgi:hypothetical protein